MEKQKNIDVLIANIIGLSLRVNRETKHTVFFEFHGHVNSVGVRIHYGGWKADKDSDYLRFFYIDDDILSPDLFEKCGQIIAKLEELLGQETSKGQEND